MGRYNGYFWIDSYYELQAYEQHYDNDGYCDNNSYDHFIKDKNYYHKWIKYEVILQETKKSYLIKFLQNELIFDEDTKNQKEKYINIWIPKKIIRDINRKTKEIFVHKPTLKNIINAVIYKITQE